jgi:hypothetical protein
MNSFLQSLFHSRTFLSPFLSSFHRLPSCPSPLPPQSLSTYALGFQLQALFAFMQLSKREVLSAERLYQTLPKEFRDGGQHDVGEFAKVIMDCLEKYFNLCKEN